VRGLMAVPKNIFLLRKNRAGKESLILKESDLPLRFTFSGKDYVVEITRSGKVIMKTEEVA
jgi:hemin uptake protein HemP